jgi:hypothetical protein
MPVSRKKPPSPKQYQARYNAALRATQALYCEVLELWRSCKKPRCRRHRRCTGAPQPCLRRVCFGLPAKRHDELEAQVIAGGPRRIPPATQMEWRLRRTPLSSVW